MNEVSNMLSMTDASLAVSAAVCLVVGLVMGKVLAKAGKPVWHGFVPALNVYELVRVGIASKSAAAAVTFTAPAVVVIGSALHAPEIAVTGSAMSTVLALYAVWRISKSFTDGGLGLFLTLTVLAPVGWPMLAFGRRAYIGATDDTLAAKRSQGLSTRACRTPAVKGITNIGVIDLDAIERDGFASDASRIRSQCSTRRPASGCAVVDIDALAGGR